MKKQGCSTQTNGLAAVFSADDSVAIFTLSMGASTSSPKGEKIFNFKHIGIGCA
jgi:hypothetical protein